VVVGGVVLSLTDPRLQRMLMLKTLQGLLGGEKWAAKLTQRGSGSGVGVGATPPGRAAPATTGGVASAIQF